LIFVCCRINSKNNELYVFFSHKIFRSYRPALQNSVPVFLHHMLQRYNRRGGIKWQVQIAELDAFSITSK
jgi:hypothetical protein